VLVVINPVGPAFSILHVSKLPVRAPRIVTSYRRTLPSARARMAEAAGPRSGMESASLKITTQFRKSLSVYTRAVGELAVNS